MFGNFKKPSFLRKRQTETVEVTDLDTGEITEEEHEIEDERSLPAVNRNVSIQSRMTNIITVSLILLLTVFLMWKYYGVLLQKREEREASKGTDKTQKAEVKVPPLNKDALASVNSDLLNQPPPPPPAPAAQTPTAANNNVQTSANNAPAGPKQPTPDEAAEKRKETAPVMFKLAGMGGGGYTTALPGSNDSSTGTRSDKLAEGLKPTYTPGVKASLIPDPDMFITKGTILDCVLDPAINSSQPGFIACNLSLDVRSTSGRVILLDKGTRLTGEYSGDPKSSDARIFVLWNRAETPNHVIIQLDSPGTDGLGRSGMDGYVDTHFIERFGAAILTSIIGDTFANLSNKPQVNGTSNSVSYPGTQKTTADLATEMFKAQANIPNTLNQNQAKTIKVFVARDLDFRGVYSLEPRYTNR